MNDELSLQLLQGKIFRAQLLISIASQPCRRQPASKTTTSQDFAASTQGESVVQLMRGGVRDDSILLISIETPISNDPAELGRVVVKPIVDMFPSKGGTYTEKTHGPADCIGHAPREHRPAGTTGQDDDVGGAHSHRSSGRLVRRMPAWIL